MTLDYKILGQLYYGPEINQTPEIPGTSGYYTSYTGSVGNVYLRTNISYAGYDGKYDYSTDGVNWEQRYIPQGTMYTGEFLYANGKFFVVSGIGGNYAAMSVDGKEWTTSQLPVGGYWKSMYGNGKYVLVNTAYNHILYSTDGVTWSMTTLDRSIYNTSSVHIAFLDNVFYIISQGEIYTSSDAINWTVTPASSIGGNSNTNFTGIAVGNGYLLLTAENDTYWVYNGVWNGSYSNAFAGRYGLQPFFANGRFFFTQKAAGSNTILFLSDLGATPMGGATVYTINYGPVDPYSVNGTATWYTLTYADGRYLMTNSFGTLVISSDLSTSSVVSSGAPNAYLGENLFVHEVNTLVEVQISIGGQGTPGSYVEVTAPQVLYTVPAGTETTVTSIYATNHDSVQRTYDLAVVPAGETLSLKHHIRWDMPVGSSDFDVNNAKLTLSAGDRIYVFPSTINKVGFTAFGVERS